MEFPNQGLSLVCIASTEGTPLFGFALIALVKHFTQALPETGLHLQE
jgi:hypothetical protein